MSDGGKVFDDLLLSMNEVVGEEGSGGGVGNAFDEGVMASSTDLPYRHPGHRSACRSA